MSGAEKNEVSMSKRYKGVKHFALLLALTWGAVGWGLHAAGIWHAKLNGGYRLIVEYNRYGEGLAEAIILPAVMVYLIAVLVVVARKGAAS